MLKRKYLFPNVIEMNYQAGRRLGVNVYLIDGGSEFVLIDIGYLEAVDDIVEMIRKMDFNLSTCKMIIATHADADHIQGLARARDLLKTKVAAHPFSVEPLESGDEILTYATIKAQDFAIPMPPCKVDIPLNEGDIIEVGNLQGCTSGIRRATPPANSPSRWATYFSAATTSTKTVALAPSTPTMARTFRTFCSRSNASRPTTPNSCCPATDRFFGAIRRYLQKAIDRLTQYQYMADFGTCAIGWPLLDEWEADVSAGRMPDFEPKARPGLVK